MASPTASRLSGPRDAKLPINNQTPHKTIQLPMRIETTHSPIAVGLRNVAGVFFSILRRRPDHSAICFSLRDCVESLGGEYPLRRFPVRRFNPQFTQKTAVGGSM